ncbi:sialic acid-binding Ig-like lectin 10 [Terrapene carolina triunguis]|uniref:sialic acid-binding Ig-like lectin 10 n=1 Tax=Terrapene triunguis TaxID=2587831 RepID=UPI001156578E|nr:sialic acid-binding Ig-like lectin 10 [Terrapene carolina triunguis]
MGRALLPQHDARERELPPQVPLWRAGGPATLRVLILALLWMGSLSQPPGFTLAAPQSVSMPEGLCVLVPCNFTYPASYDTDNPSAQLYGTWYKESATVGQDHPVASSIPSAGVSQETQGRFRLMGDPAHGDCSLQISDARRMDAGRYFLNIEKGMLDHSYRSNSDGTDPVLTISVPGLTEEPEIQISPAQGLPGMLLAGEPVIMTCKAPGRCSGPPPQITWSGPFSDTARNVSAQQANGTWAHSSALSFMPTLGDHGKELICTVTYSSAQGPSTRRAIRLHVGHPGTLVANGSQLMGQEGDSLRFLCSVTSNPPAALGWARGGRAVEGAHLAGENQLWLELPNVTAEDGGLYGCWAQNVESSAQGTFQLLVEYSPRPGTRLNSSCQRQGPSLSCSCSLRSHPPPRLQWQVDGEPLAGNGSWGALQVSSWAWGDEAVSNLSWMVSEERGPRIFCLGSNPHGTYAALHFDFSTPQRGGLTRAFIEISCKLVFVATGFILAYYLTLLYYRR